MAIDTASPKSLSGVWLRNPGAQLLGFLGANMTIGALAALLIPLLVERNAPATWSPALAAWQPADVPTTLVLALTVLAFPGGLVLMALAVRQLRAG
jgi:hypothetical protein